MTLTLTRFAHSCVLVEFANKKVLFDPGDLSWNSGAVNLSLLANIDTIVITHEHADHFHRPFIEAIVRQSPQVTLCAPQSVNEQLQGLVKPLLGGPDSDFKLFTAPHEPVLFNTPGPDNIGVHFSDIFTHPGDSHSFNETMPVLAMPMTAPWGSMVDAINLISELKPKYVLPIHDWHWRPEALHIFYKRCQSGFEDQGISFFLPKDGEPLILDLA